MTLQISGTGSSGVAIVVCFVVRMALLKPALLKSNLIGAKNASRYKEDIENARKLGCNSFRLSLGQSCS